MLVPNKGYYFNLFTVVTLGVHKFSLVITLDASQGFPCAHWDGPTAGVLSHPAFQPFEWPAMAPDSPSVVDVKIVQDGAMVVHFQFTAYRSNEDMTVTRQFFQEDRLSEITLADAKFQLQICDFSGWNVTAVSLEAGKRLYAVVPQGGVVAGDFR